MCILVQLTLYIICILYSSLLSSLASSFRFSPFLRPPLVVRVLHCLWYSIHAPAAENPQIVSHNSTTRHKSSFEIAGDSVSAAIAQLNKTSSSLTILSITLCLEGGCDEKSPERHSLVFISRQTKNKYAVSLTLNNPPQFTLPTQSL